MRTIIRISTIRLLLVFALLFSQLGGLTHGIAHALAEQTRNHHSHVQASKVPSSAQSLADDRLCDLCASYAQLGSAFGSHVIRFISIAQHISFAVPALFTVFSIAFAAFAARAPPRPI